MHVRRAQEHHILQRPQALESGFSCILCSKSFWFLTYVRKVNQSPAAWLLRAHSNRVTQGGGAGLQLLRPRTQLTPCHVHLCSASLDYEEH